MSGYTEGRRIEYLARDYLTANGYDVIRAASSKGACDLAGFKDGEVCFVNVKRTTPPGPAEREALVKLAALLPGVGVPLVALKPRGETLSFRRLVGLKAADWIPWSADYVEVER